MSQDRHYEYTSSQFITTTNKKAIGAPYLSRFYSTSIPYKNYLFKEHGNNFCITMDHVMLTNIGNVNVTKSRDCSDRTYYLDTSSNENPTNNTVSNVYL